MVYGGMDGGGGEGGVRPIRFLSLFSGIEAASSAWVPLGWECVGLAEVDKFCCRLLKIRYPYVPNLGDVTVITEQQVGDLGEIDVVIFGFPCQDLSIAGKRAGLKGERSGLFFDAMRIVRWSRARFALLENVPGLFSSNEGRDFAAVVGEMVGLCIDVPDGGWRNTGVALGELGLLEWSVLDAQWHGVPQRRRRIFALADFGDWISRPPLLFESQSLSGHPAPCRQARQDITGSLAARTGAGGGFGTDFDLGGGYELAPALSASGRGTSRAGESRGQDCVIPILEPGARTGKSTDDIRVGVGVGVDGDPMYTLQGGKQHGIFSSTGDGYWQLGAGTLRAREQESHEHLVASTGETSHCLNAGGMGRIDYETETLVTHALRTDGFDASEDGTGRGTPLVVSAYRTNAAGQVDDQGEICSALTSFTDQTSQFLAFSCKDHAADAGEVSPPLRAMGHDASHANAGGQVAICFDTTQVTSKTNRSNPQEGEPCHTLAKGAQPPAIVFNLRGCEDGAQAEVSDVARASLRAASGGSSRSYVASSAVRRLTPMECERLQGFQDSWTAIPRAADGPRYKALGNSMAVPCLVWIAKQIQRVLRNHK